MVRVRYSFGSRHTGRITNIKKQRKKYPDIMKKVIDISDIVLEILDARFIEETRNLEIEELIDEKGKKLVFVFNKCDLVDVKELERQIPSWMKPYVFVSATKGMGLSDIKARVKMEAKRILAERKAIGGQGWKTHEGERKKHGVAKSKAEDKVARAKREESWGRVHVGVIGVPNAGKSSVINFMTRRGAAKTGAKAGWTKGMQKIKMSEGILVLDTPGVIPESKYSTEKKSFAKDVKIGARSYGDVKNPEAAVEYLITESLEQTKEEAQKNAEAIDKFYGIESDGDIEVLIEKLGKKKGFLGKGGVVDEDRTLRLILRDWQEGKIKIS